MFVTFGIVLNNTLILGIWCSTILHLPGCFCPWIFFENIGFNTVVTDPFMSHLATQLGHSAGGGGVRLCNWLSLRRFVSWINHLPPACWSTFWKSNFKQQLGCRFDIMDDISFFIVFWHMQLYMSWYIISFRFYLLKYSLFFKYSCTNIFHRRRLYTFYFRYAWQGQHRAALDTQPGLAALQLAPVVIKSEQLAPQPAPIVPQATSQHLMIPKHLSRHRLILKHLSQYQLIPKHISQLRLISSNSVRTDWTPSTSGSIDWSPNTSVSAKWSPNFTTAAPASPSWRISSCSTKLPKVTQVDLPRPPLGVVGIPDYKPPSLRI